MDIKYFISAVSKIYVHEFLNPCALGRPFLTVCDAQSVCKSEWYSEENLLQKLLSNKGFMQN